MFNLGNDLETRRRGASDFVKALCKFFEPQVFQLLSSTLSSFLAYYQQDPSYNFLNKDVVYYLVSAMATKTTTTKYGATSTSQLVCNFKFFFKIIFYRLTYQIFIKIMCVLIY